MITAFTDPEQLKTLCDSQFKTIVELSKKIQELEQKNKTLENDSKLSKVFTGNKSPAKASDIIKLDKSEQETICNLQLIHLRDTALTRELTLEEARKVEIYSKILASLAGSDKSKDAEFKKLTDADLLKELGNDSTEK